jgi:hypothetical protein
MRWGLLGTDDKFWFESPVIIILYSELRKSSIMLADSGAQCRPRATECRTSAGKVVWRESHPGKQFSWGRKIAASASGTKYTSIPIRTKLYHNTSGRPSVVLITVKTG